MELEIFDTVSNIKKKRNYLLWSGHENDKNSLNFLLKINKKKIRKKYIEVINQIVDSNINKYSALYFEEISLIKMSQINEKNVFLTNEIFNCLKILTLENYVKTHKIKKIIYNGKNQALKLTLKNWFKNNFKQNTKINYKLNFRIYFLKGIIFFIKQFIKNIGLKKNKIELFDKSIFSYFVHFSKNKKKITSNLWGNLPNFFKKNKINQNWFHYYVPSSLIKNSHMANKKINQLNKNTFETHKFLNTYLSIWDYIRIIFNYCYFYFLNLIFLKNKNFFLKNKETEINLYYFLEKSYNESFFGFGLVISLSNILIFKNLLSRIPRQKFGIYIIENLNWEICLKYFWRKYNHGKLFAYFNSSLRFWDIRYCSSSKKKFNYINENPDFFLFNSIINKQIAKRLLYPYKKSKVVESLRYSHLKKGEFKKNYNNKILIVGDIILEENYLMLDLVNSISCVNKNFKLYFKPHPTISYKQLNYLKNKYSNFKIIFDDSQNFKNYNYIICSNGTSASIDCLIQNLNFAIFKGFDKLDLNPMPTTFKIPYIYNKHQLLRFLNKKNIYIKRNISKFIMLDLKLTNFQKFFNLQKYNK